MHSPETRGLREPIYFQLYFKGDKYTVYTCKAKTTRNPVYRWQIGEGAINQFAFSGPDAKMLATVGHVSCLFALDDLVAFLFLVITAVCLCFRMAISGYSIIIKWSSFPT